VRVEAEIPAQLDIQPSQMAWGEGRVAITRLSPVLTHQRPEQSGRAAGAFGCW
jgi:hypothetical protein